MRTNPDVDWNAIEATVQEWDYEQQGLTEAGALLVTAIVTYATGGAGGLVDTLATQVASGLNVAATNVAMNAGIKAGVANLLTQPSVAIPNLHPIANLLVRHPTQRWRLISQHNLEINLGLCMISKLQVVVLMWKPPSDQKQYLMNQR